MKHGCAFAFVYMETSHIDWQKALVFGVRLDIFLIGISYQANLSTSSLMKNINNYV